jgi:hypothetical protein
LISVFPVPCVQTWVVLEPQVFTSTVVPLAVASPAVSRHRPLTSMLPSDSTVQFCSGALLQVENSTSVPAVALSPVSSTHIGAIPDPPWPSSWPPRSPWLKMPDGMDPNAGDVAVDVSGNRALKLW